MKQYKAGDIQKILGINKNKLFYWIKTHQLLKPDIEEADGTGTRAKFSLRNLLEVAMIKELDEHGLNLRSIKKIKDQLEKNTSYTAKETRESKNYFDEIIEAESDEMRGWYTIRIDKDGEDFRLGIDEIGGISYDGISFNPEPVPKMLGNQKSGPIQYVSTVLSIGKLAIDLISKTKER